VGHRRTSTRWWRCARWPVVTAGRRRGPRPRRSGARRSGRAAGSGRLSGGRQRPLRAPGPSLAVLQRRAWSQRSPRPHRGSPHRPTTVVRAVQPQTTPGAVRPLVALAVPNGYAESWRAPPPWLLEGHDRLLRPFGVLACTQPAEDRQRRRQPLPCSHQLAPLDRSSPLPAPATRRSCWPIRPGRRLRR
jgi:hypothetical protein